MTISEYQVGEHQNKVPLRYGIDHAKTYIQQMRKIIK